MDLVRSTQTASSSINSRRFRYQVFLSFSGEDTRKTFTSHLYSALSKAGFHTFLDNIELPRGEDIKPQFREAIQLSQSSVIVFSQNYASSGWCLDELVMILERKRRFGQVVLPVFYHVDASDVRKQTGRVAQAFAEHQKNQSAKCKVEGWRKALAEFADLAGMVLQNQADGYEAKFIQKIVKVIDDKLSRMSLSVASDPIGIRSRIEEINFWLQNRSTKLGILGIYGMRGVGKTTMAEFLYNSYQRKFQAGSFLGDISQSSRTPTGLIEMQQKLLYDLLEVTKGRIQNIEEGRLKIEHALRSRRVLLVLDDVDHADHLDAIFKMQCQFYPGSKVIITTNNEGLLIGRHRQDIKLHKVETLRDNESLELFSLHAFGQDSPNQDYVEYSERVVKMCGGLPLALKVLGSSLSGRSLGYWESTLRKLQGIPNSEFMQKLKISYNSLQDPCDQNLFLHLACFFTGMDKDDIVRILDACDGFYPDIGIQNLIERCLVTIDGNNKVQMHHLIRDMGRDIVRSESKNSKTQRKLWNPNDSFRVLKEKKDTDMQTIEGLNLDMDMVQVILETDEFAGMDNLKLLKLNHVQLNGSFRKFPKKLRWLCWNRFSCDYLPNDFPHQNLVVLEMCYSRLKQVWRETQYLPSLKTLNLSYSHDLIKTPDFSHVPNLESLILKGCTNLVHLHDSIENLERLMNLNIEDCKSIRKLPKNMKFLKSFRLDGISIPELVTTIEVSSLLPESLVTLSLVNCNLSDDYFPKGVSLSALRNVNLSSNPITCLPDFIRGTTKLDNLTLSDCALLKSIVMMPRTRVLDISRSTLLEKVTGRSAASSFGSIAWRSNSNLLEFGTLFKLEPIERVEAEMFKIFGPLKWQRNDTIVISSADPGVLWQRRTLPIQVVHEYGFVSIFLLGNELPGRSTYTSTRGSSISFTVSSLPNDQSIQALNVFCVYAEPNIGSRSTIIDQMKDSFPQPIMATITNKSSRKKWWYGPLFFGLPCNGQTITWLCHWSLENAFNGGDEVTVSIFTRSELEVQECGIEILYLQDVQDLSTKHIPAYLERESDGFRVRYMSWTCWATVSLHGNLNWFNYLMKQSNEITDMLYIEKEEWEQLGDSAIETTVDETAGKDEEQQQVDDGDEMIEREKEEISSSSCNPLRELGTSTEDCMKLLEATEGDLDIDAYMRAFQKFENSEDTRKMFMMMSEKMRSAWVKTLSKKHCVISGRTCCFLFVFFLSIYFSIVLYKDGMH